MVESKDNKTPKLQVLKEPKNKAKLVFVGNNKLQIKKLQKLAQENNFEFYNYSENEWATLEEIDQYIQEEELSKKIVTLPVGKGSIYSLDELEADTIKKVLKNVNGNMKEASRALKIARATLYRKMEKHGLNLKKQRDALIKQQEEALKRAKEENLKRVA